MTLQEKINKQKEQMTSPDEKLFGFLMIDEQTVQLISFDENEIGVKYGESDQDRYNDKVLPCLQKLN